MSRDDHDTDLREHFAALRREESEAAPGLQLPARAHRRHSRRTLPMAATAVLVGGAAVVLLWVGRTGRLEPERSMSVSPTVATWVSPTDFLLETPGRDLLRVVPDVAFEAVGGGAGSLDDASDSGTTKSRGRI